MSTKTCSKCRKQKSLDQFGFDKSRPDGKNLYCKNCRSHSSHSIGRRINDDHEHICIKCEYQNCKNSGECRDRLLAVIEQQYQMKVTQPISEFPVYCGKLDISDTTSLKDHVYDKFMEYLLLHQLVDENTEPEDLQIRVEIRSSRDVYRQKLIVYIPLELKFSELHANKFRQFLFSHLLVNADCSSMQIPYVEGCDVTMRTCCIKYLTERFPYLQHDHITYAWTNNDEYVLVTWPKNFAMTSKEAESAVSVIHGRIVDML